MKKILNIFKNCPSGWSFAIAAIGLLVVGFIVPPMGIIDGSVLTAAGILFAFGVLFKAEGIIKSIEEGKTLSITHGETNLTVSSRDEELLND